MRARPESAGSSRGAGQAPRRGTARPPLPDLNRSHRRDPRLHVPDGDASRTPGSGLAVQPRRLPSPPSPNTLAHPWIRPFLTARKPNYGGSSPARGGPDSQPEPRAALRVAVRGGGCHAADPTHVPASSTFCAPSPE